MSDGELLAKLQELEWRRDNLRKQLEDIRNSETAQDVCQKLAMEIIAKESQDGFLEKEDPEDNEFHSGPAESGGCCVVQ